MREGADVANEQAYRKAVLDRLDRIIALLSPPPVNVGTVSNYAFGYSCPRCRSWVRYGATHICATAGTLRERGSS